MTVFVVFSLLATVPVPPECEAPPLRDVTPLKAFAQRSGTLSVGLDSVATWCFDSGGAWTGGQRPEGKKPRPIDPNAPPVGDCARALASCEEAKASLTDDLVRTLTDTLADLERPFRGQRYVPKRSGLNERPPTTVNCRERSRPELFAQAQARMDLARLASTAQNEYANYRTWLFARGLECAQAVRAGKVDPTRVAVSVDAPANPGASSTGPGSTALPPAAPSAAQGSSGVGAPSAMVAATGAGSPTGPGAERSATQPTPGGGGGVGPGTVIASRAPAAGDARVVQPGTGGEGPGPSTSGAAAPTSAPASVAGPNVPPGAGGAKPGLPGAPGGPGGTSAAAAAGGPGAAPAVGTPGPNAGGEASGAAVANGAGPGQATKAAGVGTLPGSPGEVRSGVLQPAGGSAPAMGSAAGPPVGGPGAGALPAATPTASAGGAPASTSVAASLAAPVTPTPSPFSAAQGAESMLDTWRGLASQRAKMELDRDYTLGFLASRELRDCRCQRSNPAGIVARLESNDGVAQLEADHARALACELCLQNAFAAWKARIAKQCALLMDLSPYELEVLQRSDDGNGIPPRCWEEVVARRNLDGGVLLASLSSSVRPVSPAGPVDAGVKAMMAPAAAPPVTPTGLPRFEPSTAQADAFSRPLEPAPIPLREEGRFYVRLFMSSTCAADVLPGPLLARTGDLLLLPYGASQLSLRSPCGGLAEVYWGREPTPRISEVFGRNQPLHLQFKSQ